MVPPVISNREKQQEEEEEEILSPGRPWSDLLKSITSYLIDLLDYSNFRAVCTGWRSGSQPTHLPMLPLVLLPRDPLSSDSELTFFHLPSSKKLSFSSPFPEIRNKTVLGSSFGWLALASCADSSLSLFNPFTRAHIPLPLLPPPSDDRNPRHYRPPYRQHRYDQSERAPRVGRFDETDNYYYSYYVWAHPWKVSLSKSPSSEEDGCIVAATLHDTSQIAVCKLVVRGNPPKWKHFNLKIMQGQRVSHQPNAYEFVFMDDLRFYIFSSYGSCYIVDIGADSKADSPEQVPEPEHCRFNPRFHVVKAGGEVFMVTYLRSRARRGMIDVGEGREELRVYKLGWIRRENYSNCGIGEQILRWTEVSSIGEFAFFLSGTHSLAVRASEFAAVGCRGDCIYFSGIYGSQSGGEEQRQQTGVHYMDVFDLKENKFERRSCCSWEEEDFLTDTWITPCLY